MHGPSDCAGPGTGAVVAAVREHVAGPGPDRHLSPEIEAVVRLVTSGRLVRAAEDALGARLD